MITNGTFDRFFHPWHSVPIGENAPQSVQAIIEITQGSKAKYELDKLTGFLKLDRILASHLSYPCHYGFIPQTYCQDGDPLDILLICSENLLPGSIVEATILGGLDMIDDGQQDDKILAVASHDPFMKQKKSLSDLNPELVSTIKYFFENYKKPENKTVLVQKFFTADQAIDIVQQAIQSYQENFKKN